MTITARALCSTFTAKEWVWRASHAASTVEGHTVPACTQVSDSPLIHLASGSRTLKSSLKRSSTVTFFFWDRLLSSAGKNKVNSQTSRFWHTERTTERADRPLEVTVYMVKHVLSSSECWAKVSHAFCFQLNYQKLWQGDHSSVKQYHFSASTGNNIWWYFLGMHIKCNCAKTGLWTIRWE